MTARGISTLSTLFGTNVEPSSLDTPSQDSLIILRDETSRLADRLETMNVHRDYYEGEQTLVYGSDKFKDKFGTQFAGFKDNWCQVIVDAMVNRLKVQGLRIAEELETDADVDTDTLERGIWTLMARNDFDEQQDDLHTGVLVEGRGSVIIWPDPVLGAKIDWNPGQNVIVRQDDDRRRVLWALKRWETPSGIIRVNLYYPNRLEKYVDTASLGNVRQYNNERTPFQEQVPDSIRSAGFGLIETIANPLGEVPVVEFRNRKGSEIKDAVAQQDAINFIMVSSLASAGLTGWPQRVMMTNVKEPTGGWSNDPGQIWQLPHTYDPDGNPIPSDIGEFTAADLDKFVNLVQEVLRHMAATSSTPMRFFYQSDRGGRGDASSGEALRVDDEPLIDKVERFQDRAGNSWYEVFRLAAKADDLYTGSPFPVGEPYWKNPQARHRTILLQEAQMMRDLGFPFEFIAKRVGLSPLEVQQVIEMREQEMAEAEERAAEEQEAQSESQGTQPPSPGAQPPAQPSTLD